MHDRSNSPPATNRTRTDHGQGRRILVVRLSALGDVLHALPAVEALRRERPDARIDWIVEDRAAALIEHHGAVDHVHVVPRARWRAARARPWRWPALAFGVARLLLRLWKARYDASLDFQGNLKSGLWSLFSGAPIRFGFATGEVREGNGFLTNRHVRTAGSDPHHVERGLALVAAAVGRRSLEFVRSPVPRTDRARVWVDAALATAGVPSRGFAVLHPGTSGFGSFKRWPAERFGRLSRRLAESSLRTVVTIGPGEDSIGADVARASDGTAVVLSPPDLDSLAELISRVAVFVSADTGPLHIAAGAGVPVVALFGPKDPAVYGPHAERGRESATEVVVDAAVPCRPCTLRRCPDPICMTSIEVDVVVDRVQRVLAVAR